MTDEERQEIIKALRSFAHDEHSLLSYAADELERLTREREMLLNSIYRESERAQEALAQSNAEPSAWQLVPIKPTKEMLDAADHAPDDDDWQAAMAKAYKVMLAVAPAPPRPDASAGLMDAAENVVIAFGMGWDLEGVIERLIETLPEKSVCRVRAADRSEK